MIKFLTSKYKNYSIQIQLLFITVVLVCLYFKNPSEGNPLFPPCPFHYITGFYCPGCGSLRATHQLLHGNIMAAIRYNILMVILLPFVIYLYISQMNITINGRRLCQRVLFSKKFYFSLIFIIFAYWILRNIPYYPFNLLAPR